MKNRNIDTLFICKANVGRSQIAEWFYNQYSKDWKTISCAWVEARKEKYNWKPTNQIIELMNSKWICIEKQYIHYIKDFSDKTLLKINRIIFLYDPINIKNIDDDCKKKWKTPYDYLIEKNQWKVSIYNIKDPFWQNNQSVLNIMNDIEKIVLDLLKIDKY